MGQKPCDQGPEETSLEVRGDPEITDVGMAPEWLPWQCLMLQGSSVLISDSVCICFLVKDRVISNSSRTSMSRMCPASSP